MSNIILITHWTGGDVFPFLRFGKLLTKEGHNVTVFTHCIYENRTKEMGLDFVAIDTPEEYKEINHDMAMLADPIGNKEDYVRFHLKYHGKERLLREVKLIENLCTEDTIIIARYRSSISGQIVAERKHLPYASMILAPNYFSHMELHEQLFGKQFRDEINKAREILGLPAITSWKDWLYSPNRILCAWPQWYASADETWPVGACPIGFFEDFYEMEDSLQDNRLNDLIANVHDNGNKIVIVTGGSSRMVSKDFYKTAINGCVKAGVYGIIVTPYEEYIPTDIPDTIKWVCNVPLRQLMKKADLIIHHGGMGTINEAIDAAIPQIVMPHLTDGPDNADRLVQMGIATKLPPKNWNDILITETIRKLLSESSKNICIHYQEMNGETYSANLWKDVLLQIVPYVLPEQKECITEHKEQSTVKRQLPREILLELARKKREQKQ